MRKKSVGNFNDDSKNSRPLEKPRPSSRVKYCIKGNKCPWRMINEAILCGSCAECKAVESDLPVNPQTVYQRGNQREGSPHYVFLYSDDEDSEAEEGIALERVCSVKTPPRKVEVIKVLLKPEDSLQALALRYHCTISELKRINHIHKENEIFARRHVNVPVQPFSVLTETLIDYEGASASGENVEPEPSTSREEQLINLIAQPIIVPPITGINAIILNSVCEPLAKLADDDSTSIGNHTESEHHQLLSSSELSETPKPATIDWFSCSGADWGLTWTHVLAFSLCVGIAGPLLIYFYYVAEEYSAAHSTLHGN